jgi:hypothetical protein
LIAHAIRLFKDARNTMDHPDVIKPVEFSAAKLKGCALTITRQVQSIVVLELQ